MKKEKGIHSLYAADPVRADELLWRRQTSGVSRRGFIKGSGLAAMATALGASIPFARFMPGGLMPVALANTDTPFEIQGKSGLIVLNDRPINAEAPAHLLDDAVTPAKRLFVRNNGIPPETESIDPDHWTLQIEGESCLEPQSLTVAELK